MDWKYKHFKQEAIFNAPVQNVLEAARATMAESLGAIEDTPDGFVARGYSAWHSAAATFRIAPAPNGTQVSIELLVVRSAMRGYMLFDIGGYYNGQMDKWFLDVSRRLGSAPEQILVSKTPSNVKTRRGCLTGCLVYLLVGACLGIFAIPIDRALYPQFSGSIQGPITIAVLLSSLIAGTAVFLFVAYPGAAGVKFVRRQLQRIQNKIGR